MIAAPAPLTAEQANARIDRYRGNRGLSKAAIGFVREIVRDSLAGAPTPVSDSWIRYSSSVVGLLVSKSEQHGLPLDRTVVLDRARIDRFLSHDCGHMAVRARSSYRSRLDVIASTLLNGLNDAAWPRATLSKGSSIAPWDDEQAARVALWTSGLRPATRRNRTRALLALGLGAGLRRRDMGVTGAHVVQDARGVHVTVPRYLAEDRTVEGFGEPVRTVTVAAAWEQEVLLAAERAGANLLVAPTKKTLQLDGLTNSMITANRSAPPGDELTMSRARNTWIVRHLAAGTPLPVLMEQAGVTSAGMIMQLLPYVPRHDAEDAARWMRQGRA